MDYIEKFEKSAFGLFVHFGLYSRISKGEWYLSLNEKQNKKDYFDLQKFKVKADWSKKLVKCAKETGCKYITLTTRHHDGFSLYDTQGLNTFDAPHSATGRDLIKEFVEECNKENITPFFYHTLLDWHNEDYLNNFPKYVDYLIRSIEILCTSYGKIGGFWFDGMWDKPNENWQEDRLYGLIRKYQPEAMIINNTGLSACGKVGHKEIDSVTFERGKPAFVDNSDKHRAGEMCQILNDHWGYAKKDYNYKSTKELIENLVDCRKSNCNFLLNTGLKGNGEINTLDRELLRIVGKWIKVNKNFIYNVRSCDIKADGADIVSDGENYYAIIKDVFMSADPNVALSGEKKSVVLDRKIKYGVWLDSNEQIDIVNDNSFLVKPFCYGESYSVRVAKLKL